MQIIQDIPYLNKITKEIPKEKPNKEQDKTNLKNKLKEKKTLTKTEDTEPRSSSKQRPIFKETLEFMETDKELDTEPATNSNKKKKTSRKL